VGARDANVIANNAIVFMSLNIFCENIMVYIK
jgi:hypothetical protein